MRVLAVAAQLHAGSPVRLPKPAGPYRIGTSTIDLVDESRRETAVSDPRIRRHVVVQVWYPLSARRGPAAPCILRLAAYTAQRPMPDPAGGVMNEEKAAGYAAVETNAILNAPPAANAFL